jgi:hypothetical protein
MEASRIPDHGHEHAMWKQDRYTAEQEGHRFILARSAAGHGRCKIVVGHRANGFLKKSGIARGRGGMDEA